MVMVVAVGHAPVHSIDLNCELIFCVFAGGPRRVARNKSDLLRAVNGVMLSICRVIWVLVNGSQSSQRNKSRLIGTTKGKLPV